MSESEEPKRSKPGGKPKQPLPRLWKDSESPQGEAGRGTSESAGKKARNDGNKADSKTSSKSQEAARTKQAARDWFDSRAPGKKVLLEETPALDTYESRQKARLMIGGLSLVSAAAMAWIGYRAFFYDPTPADLPVDGSPSVQANPEVRPSADQEARFMFARAHECAKNGRTEEAIAILTKVAAIYKGTGTADEARQALERPKRNLPLFTDSPAVIAQAESTEPAPASEAPAAVVKAVPEQPHVTQGEVALVLPPNPAEAVVAPPGLRQRMAARTTGVTPRPLPPGFKGQLALGVHESGWPLAIVGDRDGGNMLLVPGDIFLMGSNDTQAESPPHQVKLSSFYIDQHEVTNAQFQRFLAETQYKGQPPGKWLTDEKARAEAESLPVVNINFKDAEAYGAWAGKQLPTEAQWEMSARTSESHRYPWGDGAPRWSRPRAYDQIDPIMSFPEDVSPYGVFDLAGNVEEWTRDWFDTRYFRQNARTVVENPTGAAPRTRSPQRVVKGGSKTFSVSFRRGVPPEKRLGHLGFRCVLAVEAPRAAAAPTGTPGPAPAGLPPNTPNPANVPF
jgi:formylglycine-generating enzyme required for sulfatase activity